MCIGVYVGRHIEPYPLPFTVSDLEDIRAASLWNRFLGSLPFDFYTAAVVTIVFISPFVLALNRLLPPVPAVFIVIACVLSIRVMYPAGGFPFTRLPVAMLGLAQIIFGMALVIRWACQ
jgi:hypothetical protein